MGELIGLDHVAISPEGATVSMGIQAGQWVGIYGPAGSGKSALLNAIAGLERPARGVVSIQTAAFQVQPIPNPRRTRALHLARGGRGPRFASVATEALMATRLWEHRNDLISQLSPSQRAAAELLPALTTNEPLIVLDENLDRLDPWAKQAVVKQFRQMREAGKTLIVATNQVDLAREFDIVLVVANRELKFAGSPEELIRTVKPHEVIVEADDQPGVRALVQPFSVSIQQCHGALRLEAAEGQQLSADLLLKGYGNVRAVVQKPPTFEEALLLLVR
jgi:ABC-type multidrug transport system ATPase subunit